VGAGFDGVGGELPRLLLRADSLLLAPTFPPRKGIRLLGVSLSSLQRRAPAAAPQLRLAL
jgi:hypothetical protein